MIIETLEEAAQKHTTDFKTRIAFKLGAEWQKQKIYSNQDYIKWDIDHSSYVYNSFLLSGDYNGHRFTIGVVDSLFNIPLMYAKWRITKKYKILYPERFKNKLK
jgi:hypothetical protein